MNRCFIKIVSSSGSSARCIRRNSPSSQKLSSLTTGTAEGLARNTTYTSNSTGNEKLNSNYIYSIKKSKNDDNNCYNYSTCRLFSSRGKKDKGIDPFKTLGVKKTAQYKDVKRAFLKVAMKCHPDTNTSASKEEEEKNREIFITARKAFELLAEDTETGSVVLRCDQEEDDVWSDAAMDSWFKDETGFDVPFMSAEMMREVAEMTETIGGGGEARGLDRDGGMWELARMVTRTVKSGGDAKQLLQLNPGETKGATRQLRRRRKR